MIQLSAFNLIYKIYKINKNRLHLFFMSLTLKLLKYEAFFL